MDEFHACVCALDLLQTDIEIDPMKLLLGQDMRPERGRIRPLPDVAMNEPVHIGSFILPQRIQVCLDGLRCQTYDFFHSIFSNDGVFAALTASGGAASGFLGQTGCSRRCIPG